MNRLSATCLLAIGLLFLPCSALAGSSGGYDFDRVYWNDDGYVTMDLTNHTGGERTNIEVVVTFSDEEGEVILETRLTLASLNDEEGYSFRSYVGKRDSTPARVKVAIFDDRTGSAPIDGEVDVDENQEPEKQGMELVFEGEEYYDTEPFALEPGSYQCIISFSGSGDFYFMLLDSGNKTQASVRTGRPLNNAIYPFEVEQGGEFTISIDTLGAWSVRIVDTLAMEGIQEQIDAQERNQLDIETTDDGTLIISN